MLTGIQAPKKAKPKKPTSSANAAATAASMNTPSSWKECLGAPVLTQAVWQLIVSNQPQLPLWFPSSWSWGRRGEGGVTSGAR